MNDKNLRMEFLLTLFRNEKLTQERDLAEMLAAEKSQTFGILKATIGCGTREMEITIARCHLLNIAVDYNHEIAITCNVNILK